MTLSIPTRNQIAAQVDAILAREPDARCIAIRSPAPDAWPDTIVSRNSPFSVRWCASPLAARQYLSEMESGELKSVVLLTNLGERELGSDVVARLSRGRVFQIESWDMVSQLFQAREVDSRLASQNWMASLLLENVPPGGYAPVAGGFLDLDTAWSQILRSSLGLETGRPDVLTLLRWTTSRESVARYAALPETARQHVSQWISETSGPVGELVMRCVNAGSGLDSLPIGLVCGVVFTSSGEPQPDLAAAAVRLERYTGDQRIRDEEGKRWADAAAWVVRNSNAEIVHPHVARADSLLHELHLISFAGLSDVLPSGFEARLSGVAKSLSSFLRGGSAASLAEIERTVALALAHDVAQASASRQERAVMALRLCRWLRPPRKSRPVLPCLPTLMHMTALSSIGHGSSCWEATNWPRSPRRTRTSPWPCVNGARSSIVYSRSPSRFGILMARPWPDVFPSSRFWRKRSRLLLGTLACCSSCSTAFRFQYSGNFA